MKPNLNHHFPVELIDFRVKRLPIEHNPRISHTVKSRTSFNGIAKHVSQLLKDSVRK